MPERVFVGMSGGVDSALAAALLVEQGYDVRGIYMRNWSRDLPGFRCTWADDLADAERVAVTLGIDLDVWDFEDEYYQTVVDYVVDGYAHGLTPNPDVMCNQTIKFGSFLDRALDEGADFVATGHYARVGEPLTAGGPSRLLRAADEHKDQTYFLWRVTGKRLSRVLFPIGGYASKDQVRAAAAERHLGVERRPDSDGICFVGPVGIRTFLLDVLERRPGDIVEWETGQVLGTHDGAFLFTVGQRKGLNLGGGPARYVVATDTAANIVYVSANKDCPGLWLKTIHLADCHWIAGCVPASGRYLVRTRHTGALREATLEVAGDGAEAGAGTPSEVTEGGAGTPPGVAKAGDGATSQNVTITFDEPIPAIAPGQSAVIYDGLVCLGGGIIQPDASVLPAWAQRG